jgi:hypothetical protein
MKASASLSQSNFTAIVHAVDGVRLVASAQCPQQLTAQIVAYVRARCDDVLWPSVAKRVRDLVEDDKPYAAIALYFAQVGERWDEEQLELGGLSLGALGVSENALAEVG